MSVFAVSKVRLDPTGTVTDVLWGVVDTKSNHWVSPEVVTTTREVLEAIDKGDQVVALFPATGGYLPGRQFVAVGQAGGTQSLALDGPADPAREIRDMDRLAP